MIKINAKLKCTICIVSCVDTVLCLLINDVPNLEQLSYVSKAQIKKISKHLDYSLRFSVFFFNESGNKLKLTQVFK